MGSRCGEGAGRRTDRPPGNHPLLNFAETQPGWLESWEMTPDSMLESDLQKLSHFNRNIGLEDMNPKLLEHNQKLTTEILDYLSV